MKKSIVLVSVIIFGCSLFPDFVSAVGPERNVTDKELLQGFHSLDIKITRLEEGQKNISQRIDKLDKRIDGLAGRIDGLAGRIDGLAGRIDGLTNMVMGGFIAIFFGIFSLIGFVIWDRRTALSPVIIKTKELEEKKDLNLKVLKEYALKEPKMAEVLKTLGLM